MADSQTVKYGHILEEGERGWKTYTILYIISHQIGYTLSENKR